jgi:hypothetical protein
MKKISIFDKIVIENLVITTNFNSKPVEVLEDYIVHIGTLQKENNPKELRTIYLYFDFDFYLDILIDIAKYENKIDLIFSSNITGNYFQIGDKCFINFGNVSNNKKVLFKYKQKKKNS